MEITAKTRAIALVVAVAFFMQNFDANVLATSLPTMAEELGVNPIYMNVVLSSYLLSLCIFIPASGWIAGKIGTRTTFCAAIAVFTLSSVMCGMASNLESLIVGRVTQGVGGALMVPVGRLLVVRSVAKEQLASAMAWVTFPALVGPVVGPFAGGIVTTYLGWRWNFFLNLPVGLAGILAAFWLIQNEVAVKRNSFDLFGFLIVGSASTVLLFAVESNNSNRIPGKVALCLIVISAILLGLASVYSIRVKEPILDFTLLKTPTMMVAVVAGTFYRVGMGALPFLLPTMLQVGLGFSAIESGTISLTLAVGALLAKSLVPIMLRRFGFRTLLSGGGLIAAGAIMVLASTSPRWPVAMIYVVVATVGLVRSVLFTAYNTLAFADIEREKASAATSFYGTAQQLSMMLGAASGATALSIGQQVFGQAQLDQAAFRFALVAVATVIAAASPFCFLMTSSAGSVVSKFRAHH